MADPNDDKNYGRESRSTHTSQSNKPTGGRGAPDRSMRIIIGVIVVLLVVIGIYAWAGMDSGEAPLDGSEPTATETQ